MFCYFVERNCCSRRGRCCCSCRCCWRWSHQCKSPRTRWSHRSFQNQEINSVQKAHVCILWTTRMFLNLQLIKSFLCFSNTWFWCIYFLNNSINYFRQGVKLDQVRFVFDGQAVQATDTPGSVRWDCFCLM